MDRVFEFFQKFRQARALNNAQALALFRQYADVLKLMNSRLFPPALTQVSHVFEYACLQGNLPLMKELFKRDSLLGFTSQVYGSGYQPAISWLHRVTGAYPNTQADMRVAAQYGHLHLLKPNFPAHKLVRAHNLRELAVISACYGQTHVLDWIFSFFPELVKLEQATCSSIVMQSLETIATRNYIDILKCLNRHIGLKCLQKAQCHQVVKRAWHKASPEMQARLAKHFQCVHSV